MQACRIVFFDEFPRTSNSRKVGISHQSIPSEFCITKISMSISYSCMTTDLCNMYDDIKFDLLDSLSTIEFYRNTKVSPAGPIRRQDIKIGDCHLAFSHLLMYRARAELGV